MGKVSYAPPAASPLDLANETTARVAGDALALQKASNLGDVNNAATARTNLGVDQTSLDARYATQTLATSQAVAMAIAFGG